MKRHILKWCVVSPVFLFMIAILIGACLVCFRSVNQCSFADALGAFTASFQSNTSDYFLSLILVLPSMFALWLLESNQALPRQKVWVKVAILPFVLVHIWGAWRWAFEGLRCWKRTCSYWEFMSAPLFGAGLLFFGAIIWYLLVVLLLGCVRVGKAKLHLG